MAQKKMGRPKKYPELYDEDWVRAHCTETPEMIAQQLGCSYSAAAAAFRRFDIPRRPAPSPAPSDTLEPTPPIPDGPTGPLQDVLDPLEGLFYLADALRDVNRQLDAVTEKLSTIEQHLSTLTAAGLRDDIESIRETLRRGFA